MEKTELTQQIVETWQIHGRITLHILNAIEPKAFNIPKPKRGKGRHFSSMFAHIHNVRLMWLKPSAPDLAEGLSKIGHNDEVDRASLYMSLKGSAEAIEKMLSRAIIKGKVRGFKPHATAFLGYLISHEAYHHGEIGVALREAGYPLNSDAAYGQWDWSKRLES